MTDVVGSVTTAVESLFNTNEEGKTTPRKMTFDKDARSMENGGTYPNYWSHKTRSGHNFIMDDSEGNETVTIQHRSGSALQFRPDGGVSMTTHNGKYEVVFGEDRVTVTGARDITVKGDASMRVYGNHNVTVHGDHNMTVLGDHNVTAKNMNYSVRGNIDTEAKNINTRVEGSGTFGFGGALSMVGKDGVSMGSTGQNVHIFAGKSIKKKAGKDIVREAGGTHYSKQSKKVTAVFELTGGPVTPQGRRYGAGAGSSSSATPTYQKTIDGTTGKVNVKHQDDFTHTITGRGSHTTKVKGSGSINKEATTGDVSVKAPAGTHGIVAQNHRVNATQNIEAIAAAALNMSTSGSAVFRGLQTSLGGTGLTNLVGTGGLNIDALGGLLNLNGGLGQIGSLLGLAQMVFDFIDAEDAPTEPTVTNQAANQPQEEPDATGEINSWQ